jgi:predicted 3-demethylubiquinone-9 3-methyltransferase (glyoxalase superfamily)
MQNLSPCLWFNDQAEEAAKLYTSLFPNSKIGKIARYTEASAKASGRMKDTAMTVSFELAGQKFLGLNGGPAYQFTPGVSLFVYCETEKEIDKLWSELSKNGKTLFELKKYDWSEKYGWCEDRFGLTWQVMIGKGPKKIANALLFMDKLFGRGKEALEFYTSHFPNSKIDFLHEDPVEKTIMHSTFTLDGESFVLMEGKKEKVQKITPAVSFIVACETQKEIDAHWDYLSQGGKEIQCGWVEDKFGVHWQIVPNVLGDLMSGEDKSRANRCLQAMLSMKKLDIEKLKNA